MTCVSAYIYRSLIFVENNIRLYQRNSEVHDHFTRHALQLRPTKHNTARFERGLFYSALSLFNKLPDNVKTMLGTPEFKGWLRGFLPRQSLLFVIRVL